MILDINLDRGIFYLYLVQMEIVLKFTLYIEFFVTMLLYFILYISSFQSKAALHL